MKIRSIMPVVVMMLVIPVISGAQTTGKIVGTVIGTDTNEGLPGANIMIEGTYKGTAADLKGDFFMINVRPGEYTLVVSMIGYKTQKVQGVRVSVNRTTTVNVRMDPTVVEGELVVVQAERVVIKKDQTSSIRNVSSDQIDIIPVENMTDVVAMQAGVVDGHFRGGRLSEVAYLIDGLPVTEAFGGSGRSIDLEPEAVEDLEVITGTFNAEYGNAMSGVVNAVTKGGGEKYHGSISVDFANYFTPNKDIFIGLEDTELNRIQDYKIQLSGPVWKDWLTFFANFRFQQNKNHLNGIRRFNVDDYSNFESVNPGEWFSETTGDSSYVAMNRSKNMSFIGKLSVRPYGGMRLSLLYTRNNDEWYDYNHAFKYNPDGMANTHRISDMLAYEMDHMLSESAFYELKLSYMRHDHGWYIFENPLDKGYVHDRYLRDLGPGFFTGGQQKGHDERLLKEYGAKLDFSWQITKNHGLKTGAQFTLQDLKNNYKEIRNYYYGTENENTMYEPVTLPDSSIYSDIYRVKPVSFSAYIQDKMEFDEMVINLGVRYDYFDPRTVYPSQLRNPANQLDFPDDPEKESTYPDADPKVQVSPRFGLSYQLGRAALLRFSYGHFFQMPPLYALYQNHAFRISPVDYGTTLGNAQIKAMKTVKYEVGLWQELMQDMGLEVALFYSDIYDLLTAKVITTFNQIEYGLFSNLDYGNAKGLELKFDFRRGRFYTFVNYTLQYTRGNADNPTQTFDRAGNSMDPINRLIPMSWDQRHTLNITAGYNTRRYGATLTGYFDSGAPYTWEPISESILARVNLYPNNAYRPSRISLDLSGFYEIPIRGDIRARFTLNVYNLLDRLNEVWVNSQTGRAYTAVIRDVDEANHRSDFNEFIDRVRNPSMYAAPRLVKVGFGIAF
jgi:outer membrane receptor protein involved in Fe transport